MRKLTVTSLLLAPVLALAGAQVLAGHGGNEFEARLSGFQETPLTLSSPGFGRFEGELNRKQDSLSFELMVGGTTTDITAAHIHFGAKATSGGVSAFLCGGGGKPACPAGGGKINGTIVPADILGPAGQGIDAGQFDEVIRAMRAGATYVNVHTTQYPSGEIRGQVHKD